MMGRALKVSILAVFLAAALLAYACGKHHAVGRGAIQAANPNSPQSLNDAQAALDALACPEGVDAALWTQLKAALKVALDETASSGTPRSPARLDDESKEPGWLARRTQKSANAPPAGEANRVNDLAISDNGDGTYTLSWHYRNLGDYDQNGTVAVEDIIPLAQHFGETWASGEENTLPAVIDGSANGKVGVEDITSIAVNLDRQVADYMVQTGGGPEEPFIDSVVVAFTDADGVGRLAFTTTESLVPGAWIVAAPRDSGGNPGVPSIPIATAVWIHSWGEGDEDFCRDIALDSYGNVYATGETANIDTGQTDILTFKYSTQGSLLWLRSWNSSPAEGGYDVTVDSDGSVYVVGETFAYSGAGQSDILLLKYSADGALIWQKAWGGELYDCGRGIEVGENGRVYVTGYTSSFGHGGSDLLLLVYDTDGILLLEKTWGGDQWDYGTAVDADESGNIYVVGETKSFGAGYADAILLKFSPAGKLLWQRTWGGPYFDWGSCLTIDEGGDIFITGNTTGLGAGYGDLFLLKYSSSGDLLWQKTWGGNKSEGGSSISIGAGGCIFAAGKTYSFGAGNADFIILEYSSAGDLLWQQAWGQGDYDPTNAVAIDMNGQAYLAGSARSAYGSYRCANGIEGSPEGIETIPNASESTPTGIESSPEGIEGIPEGVHDMGGGDQDMLVMKMNPWR